VSDASALIARLGLKPLGFEGGYFRENARSGVVLEGELPRAFTGTRNLHTAIYYMLAPDSQSLMHRLRSDEVYHFYAGDPVDLLLLRPDGSAETVVLGPDFDAGQVPQQLVPAGVWQGGMLRPGGRYALMGTTMSPGFDLRDFELGRFDVLSERYPDVAERIRALTPALVTTARLELRAATRDLIYAELHDRASFATGLDARVPDDWPPEGHGRSGLERAFEALGAGPDQRGWWHWYFIDRSQPDGRCLVGVGGFRGPPHKGRVEVDYAIDPSRSGEGLAAEAVRGLVDHARRDPRVLCIEAETAARDEASSNVLKAVGFEPVANGSARRARRFVVEIEES